ncbi:MAG: hypothetical protein NXY57DRAFT_27391 [Lentinula lateritia]|uniref:RxLR effector protein n=1 Tax=Lentinula lateritia TaxID=40482 RepID=A0ABQ8V516_9AGAR|nr:MAG: hypothetical protein NXY57DRAFT_27391 [Lentinula lateritia]KAJ4474752.1 hypothetical protein C8R41DRAFT_847536 [Lentinula lateritia]
MQLFAVVSVAVFATLVMAAPSTARGDSLAAANDASNPGTSKSSILKGSGSMKDILRMHRPTISNYDASFGRRDSSLAESEDPALSSLSSLNGKQEMPYKPQPRRSIRRHP